MPDADGPNPDRRSFVHAALLAGGTGAAASIGYPIARFLEPLRSERPAGDSVDVCADAELAPGQMKMVRVAGTPVIIVRRHDASLAAWSASCTHLGCTLGFRPAQDELFCACHGAAFDPATGSRRYGPARTPLTPFSIEVRHGRVVVQP